MAFIRLADLVVNLNCIAVVKFSSYTAFDEGREVPVVSLCLKLPEGAIDGSEIDRSGDRSLERLEFEGDMALEIWNYFLQSDAVTVLFE